MGGRPQGAADHFLMTADKNPNRKGLELDRQGPGARRSSPSTSSSAAIDAGTVKALYAIGTEVPGDAAAFAEAAAQARACSWRRRPTSRPSPRRRTCCCQPRRTSRTRAPSLKLDGITQRFRQAYPPKGERAAALEWAAELARELGGAARLDAPRARCSASWRRRWPSCAAFDWDKPLRRTSEKPGINAAARGRRRASAGLPRVRHLRG